MIRLKLINKTYSNEIIINKSRFITSIYRVNSIEEVNTILAQTKKKYYDATHNCYGYILGENSEIQKCSDDGEPSKTAGFPILDVLKKQEVTNILCIVTRYFGGILLGAGGLVRAYSESASEVLKLAEFYTIEQLLEFELRVGYSEYNTILSYLNEFNVIESLFNTDVLVNIGVKLDRVDEFITNINNKTSGKAIVIKKDIIKQEIKI